MSGWYRLEGYRSRGQTVEKATTLAGLHEARAAHAGQFWTPTSVARFAWALAARVDVPQTRRRTVLDTSIGSGRLVQFADPARDIVYGCDTDAAAVDALSANLGEAGFYYELLPAGLETVAPEGFDVALINPPYSIALQSPVLEPGWATAHGRFGPSTHARSHEYAVQQAMTAARLTVAVLPRSCADALLAVDAVAPRIQAIFDLPADTFVDEGARVATSLVVIGARRTGALHRERIAGDNPRPPEFPLTVMSGGSSRPRLRPRSVEDEGPTITRAVTGDPAVRVYRHGRHIKLGFRCGLTEARVLNAIHRRRVDRAGGRERRRPASIWSVGQGVLDLEIHLCQPDPMASFEALLATIAGAGGVPAVDTNVRAYLRRRIAALAIARTPLHHTIEVPPDGRGSLSELPDHFQAVARERVMLDPTRWGSPVIQPGEAVEVTRCGDGYRIGHGPFCVTWSRSELETRFDLPLPEDTETGWVAKFAGRQVAFPEKARTLRTRARALGIDQWCSWSYQFHDVIECCMTPGEVVLGWMMGLGKARASAALALLGGGARNLVVVEANLLEDMADEFRDIGLDDGAWQIIEHLDALADLRCLNIISYTRLRMALDPRQPRKTYAKALRRRVHTVIADEGHAIANETTQQVRALYDLSPKRRYAMTGTPVPNYPRNLLPLVLWVAGDGTSAQPYGRHAPYMNPALVNSTDAAERGFDAFREQFVTLEWVTYDFTEDLQGGGKREVPSLRNIDAFREYASRFVLRRVWEEPAVAPYVQVPKPEQTVAQVLWDPDHLDHYLDVAEDFSDYYRALLRSRGHDGQRVNLIMVLARMRAVFDAANFPQRLEGRFRWPGGLTSKQRFLLEALGEQASEGRKTICFAESPDLLAILNHHLQRDGVNTVLYTGKVATAKRRRGLRADFRRGDATTLLASFGVAQTGLNIPEATDEIFANRLYSPRQESQAMYRALRPQQKNRLRVAYPHLEGSIDEYQAQMVAHKADTARAGLDWGTPEYTADDFQHWMTFLSEFVDGTEQLRARRSRITRKEVV